MFVVTNCFTYHSLHTLH